MEKTKQNKLKKGSFLRFSSHVKNIRGNYKIYLKLRLDDKMRKFVKFKVKCFEVVRTYIIIIIITFSFEIGTVRD